jgi:hypothetical protein
VPEVAAGTIAYLVLHRLRLHCSDGFAHDPSLVGVEAMKYQEQMPANYAPASSTVADLLGQHIDLEEVPMVVQIHDLVEDLKEACMLVVVVEGHEVAYKHVAVGDLEVACMSGLAEGLEGGSRSLVEASWMTFEPIL